MRILVISDSHGNAGRFRLALEAQPSAKTVLFLGDGLREAEDIANRFPDRTFYAVRGNCDFFAASLTANTPETREEIFGGKKIFMTHGHIYGVKGGCGRLEDAAKACGADIALFGHTHIPYTDYDDGIYYMNPGSLGYGGEYGFIDITPAGIVTNIVKL